MSELQDDLLINVLSMLPIKSVLRFRYISKSWCRLIESSFFSRIHRLKQLELNQREYVSPIIIVLRNHKLYTFDFASALKPVYKEISNVPQMNKPKIIGIQSCNGVLCLRYMYRKLVIWNPLSHKYRKLYYPIAPRYSDISLGFGYDIATDDYKVVSLQVDENDINPTSAAVYSVKLNRWKNIDGFSYMLRDRSDGVFQGDSVHWLARDNKCIVAFNLTTDNFREISLPSCCSSPTDKFNWIQLRVLANSLLIACKDKKMNVILFEMRSYGAKDSWTELMVSYVFRFEWWFKPIKYMEDGKLLIQTDNGNLLLLYDPKNQSKQRICQVGEAYSYVTYVPTLGLYGGKFDEAAKPKESRRQCNQCSYEIRNKRAKF